MKVYFREISGRVYSKTFTNSNTIQNAIDFLMKQLNISNDRLFLISTKKNQLFYQTNENLKQIAHRHYIFYNFNDINNDQSTTKSKMKIPSENLMKTIRCINNNKIIGSEEKKIHFQYCSTLKKEPEDLQDRMNQLMQLGYDQNDCLEALRQNNYNVNEAAQFITHLFSNSFYRVPMKKQVHQNTNGTKKEEAKSQSKKTPPNQHLIRKGENRPTSAQAVRRKPNFPPQNLSKVLPPQAQSIKKSHPKPSNISLTPRVDHPNKKMISKIQPKPILKTKNQNSQKHPPPKVERE